MDDLFENNEFDKKIKERYDQYSVNPDEDLWTGINSKLLANKSIRSQQRIQFYRAAAIVLGLAIISIFGKQVFFNKDNAPSNEDHLSAQVEITDQPPTHSNEKDDLIVESSEGEPNKIEDKSYDLTSPLNTSDHPFPIDIDRTILEKAAEESKTAYRIGDESDHSENFKKKEEFIIPLRPRNEIINERSLSSLNLDSLAIDQSLTIPEQLEKILTNPTKRWVLNLYASPILTSRFISVNQKFAPKSNLDKSYFNSRENSQLGWSIGITAGYKFSQKLLIKSGLELSSQKLKFQTKGNNLVPVSDKDFILYSSFGGILLQLESDQVNPESILNSSVLLNYISLPVGIEYKVMPNTAVALGLDIKYLFSQEINWESSEDGDNSQSINGIQGVRSNNIGFSIGIVNEQRLFKNVSILINPVFRSNLTTVNKLAPVKAFPNSFGIRLGIRKYL
jgi:hypothetical protein